MLAYFHQSAKKINQAKTLELIIVFSVLLFSPSLFNFFSADDWFHLRLSQIENFSQFLNFFKFTSTLQSASFYRPIPTQLFFFIFQSLFGLNQIPYYFFVLICFAFSLFLVYQLSFLLSKSANQALITTFIYSFSVTNFSRIYFLSAFQEIILVIFSLLCLIKYLEKKHFWSLIFFVLALMSKETAVIIPLLLVGLNFLNQKLKIKKLLPFFLILSLYLYLRLQVFGLTQGDTYVWNFSPKTTLNTLMWYVIWTLGAPELFVDYLGGGFRVIPRFFTDYPIYSYLILIGLLSTISLLILNTIRHFKKLNQLTLFAGFWFLITLLPVIFLPQHKFTLELGLPLFGFALFISQVTVKHKLGILLLLVFLIFNLSMNRLTYTRDYSTRRANLSRQIYKHLQNNYPDITSNTNFIFTNEKTTIQIDHAISGSNMFQVFYHNHNLEVFYPHSTQAPTPTKSPITIDSNQFFN